MRKKPDGLPPSTAYPGRSHRRSADACFSRRRVTSEPAFEPHADPVDYLATRDTPRLIPARTAQACPAAPLYPLVPPNALPGDIEQLIFENVAGPLASFIVPSTPFHRIGRPLSRPATMTALQLWPAASKLMVICDAPLANCMTPTSLSPAKWKVWPDSPGPASRVSAAPPSRRDTRAKMRPALLI
jgi:hypothetical protein